VRYILITSIIVVVGDSEEILNEVEYGGDDRASES